MSGHGKQHSLANSEDHADASQWTSLQTTVTSSSGSWDSASESVTISGANWDSAHTTVDTNSAIWIKDTFCEGFGRNAANITSEWNRTYNGTPCNLAPIVFPFEVTIIAISTSINATGTWDAELYKNSTVRAGGTPLSGSAIAILNTTSNTQALTSSLSITLTAGEELGCFVRAAVGVDYPKVNIWFERTYS